jgi:hypothetical protein
MAAPRRRSPKATLLAHPLLRRAGILLAVSFGLSFMLITYLFGFQDGYFAQLLRATFVWFVLLGVTFLAVVPFVNWAADNWFGRTWAEAPTPQPTRRPKATNTPKAAAPKPARYAPRTGANSD